MEQIITDFFKYAAPMDLAKQLFLFVIAWRIVRRDVEKHFNAMESGIRDVALKVSELKDVVKRVEQTHASRLGTLEDHVETLSMRVKKIETETHY